MKEAAAVLAILVTAFGLALIEEDSGSRPPTLASLTEKHDATVVPGERPWPDPVKGQYYTLKAFMVRRVEGAIHLFRRQNGEPILVNTTVDLSAVREGVSCSVVGRYAGEAQYTTSVHALRRTAVERRASLLEDATVFAQRKAYGGEPKNPKLIHSDFAPIEDPLGGHTPPRMLRLPKEEDLYIGTFDPTETPEQWQRRMRREENERHRAWIRKLKEAGYDTKGHAHAH